MSFYGIQLVCKSSSFDCNSKYTEYFYGSILEEEEEEDEEEEKTSYLSHIHYIHICRKQYPWRSEGPAVAAGKCWGLNPNPPIKML